MTDKDEDKGFTDYVVADSVWGRVMQIVQEAMLTGIDCVDLLREMRLRVCNKDPNVLVMTQGYVQHVIESHKKLEEEMERRMAEHKAKLIIDPNHN